MAWPRWSIGVVIPQKPAQYPLERIPEVFRNFFPSCLLHNSEYLQGQAKVDIFHHPGNMRHHINFHWWWADPQALYLSKQFVSATWTKSEAEAKNITFDIVINNWASVQKNYIVQSSWCSHKNEMLDSWLLWCKIFEYNGWCLCFAIKLPTPSSWAVFQILMHIIYAPLTAWKPSLCVLSNDLR